MVPLCVRALNKQHRGVTCKPRVSSTTAFGIHVLQKPPSPLGRAALVKPRGRDDLVVLVQVQVMGSQEQGMRVSLEWVSTLICQCQRSTSLHQDLTCLTVHLQLPHSVFSLYQSKNACTSWRGDYTDFQGDVHFLSLLQDCLNKTSS